MIAQAAGPILSHPAAWWIGLAVGFGPLVYVAGSVVVEAWQSRRGLRLSRWRRALDTLGDKR